MTAAKRTELAELKAAQATALRTKNVDEVTAIAARLREVQYELDAFDPNGLRGVVVAKAAWQRVATLPSGTYAVTAGGQWVFDAKTGAEGTCGPDGGKYNFNGQTVGCLVARVAGGSPVKIGSKGTLVVPDKALVEMRCWDGSVDDNRGEVKVVIVRQ
jgi:hypothetical protein